MYFEVGSLFLKQKHSGKRGGVELILSPFTVEAAEGLQFISEGCTFGPFSGVKYSVLLCEGACKQSILSVQCNCCFGVYYPPPCLPRLSSMNRSYPRSPEDVTQTVVAQSVLSPLMGTGHSSSSLLLMVPSLFLSGSAAQTIRLFPVEPEKRKYQMPFTRGWNKTDISRPCLTLTRYLLLLAY